MSTIVLSDRDLVDLTRKVRPSAQARVLRHMRVPFRTRPDGTIAVLLVEAAKPERQEPQIRMP